MIKAIKLWIFWLPIKGVNETLFEMHLDFAERCIKLFFSYPALLLHLLLVCHRRAEAALFSFPSSLLWSYRNLTIWQTLIVKINLNFTWKSDWLLLIVQIILKPNFLSATQKKRQKEESAITRDFSSRLLIWNGLSLTSFIGFRKIQSLLFLHCRIKLNRWSVE